MLRRKKRKSGLETGYNPVSRNNSLKKPKVTEVLGEAPGQDEVEKILEKTVLGGEEEILDKLNEKKERHEKKKTDELTPKPVWDDEDDDNLIVKPDAKEFRFKKLPLVGQTEIEGTQYKHTLKKQFEKISGTPSWAKLRWEKSESEGEEDSDSEELLKRTGNYLTGSLSLPKGTIELKKCRNINRDSPNMGKLKCVEFHPSAQVALTAGMDQTLRLFQVDGKNNPKIQSVFMENFPIHTAHFTTDGQEVVMASRFRAFYYYDMIAGKVINVPKIKALEEIMMKRFEVSPDGRLLVFLGGYGRMHLISTQSKEWICTLKMNGNVNSIAFTRDGSKMLSFGDDGEVYVWDMATRDCIHRFIDEGCIKGTAITVSQNDQYIACGSYSGIVNVYDDSCLTSQTPSPIKAVPNLTSPCTTLKFNPATEILAMASNYVDRAFKLVHLPSMTVFSNFPEKADPLQIIKCVDFSLNGGYMAMGNHKGKALLYRVKHYGNY